MLHTIIYKNLKTDPKEKTVFSPGVSRRKWGQVCFINFWSMPQHFSSSQSFAVSVPGWAFTLSKLRCALAVTADNITVLIKNLFFWRFTCFFSEWNVCFFLTHCYHLAMTENTKTIFNSCFVRWDKIHEWWHFSHIFILYNNTLVTTFSLSPVTVPKLCHNLKWVAQAWAKMS